LTITGPASEAVVFRPRKLRVVAASASGVLIVVSIAGWTALPLGIRDLFTVSQRVTLLAVLGALVFTLWAISSSYVRADRSGVTIRNGLRTRRVAWNRVQGVLLRPGDPWAMLLVGPDPPSLMTDADAETRQMMGIQRGDGAAAQAAVEELRRRSRATR
jgi:hypothetical protein